MEPGYISGYHGTSGESAVIIFDQHQFSGDPCPFIDFWFLKFLKVFGASWSSIPLLTSDKIWTSNKSITSLLRKLMLTWENDKLLFEVPKSWIWCLRCQKKCDKNVYIKYSWLSSQIINLLLIMYIIRIITKYQNYMVNLTKWPCFLLSHPGRRWKYRAV